MSRNLAKIAFAGALLVGLPGVAGAQAPAAPPAPEGQPQPAPPGAPQYSINQSVGDWVVRCVQTAVKSPAPCEVMQTTVNKDTKQRISAFSLAYVPSREAYAMQIVVPTGVALSKGLQLGTALTGAKFNRCERDGCYVEMLLDNAAVTSLSGSGKSTTISVVGYGQSNEIKLPVSLTGFPEALDRMKGYAKDRAIALPNNASPLPAAPATSTPGPVANRAAAPAKK
ncbi:MAG TPA: invasion associated locus B family protein [Micropepsaceae bacterium]|nr:invasion associated locus B family protein [Micropepsaceae bacterium]